MKILFFSAAIFIAFSCEVKNQAKSQTSIASSDSVSMIQEDSGAVMRHTLVAPASAVLPQEQFRIEVVRGNTTGNLVTGALFVNDKLLGTTYENNDLKINPGMYPGYMRYISQKGFVQGPDGYMGDTGDFLLEIGNVKWSNGTQRTSLLFHGGNKADQSQGCIMLGPVSRDADGNRVLPQDHPLRKLRTEFYGTNDPISSPNKNITISIK